MRPDATPQVAPAPEAPPASPSRLANQDRAVHALQSVQAVQGPDKKAQQKYRSLIESFPAEVRILGAGQAIALLLSKAGDSESGQAARSLVAHLRDWLVRSGRIPPGPAATALLDGFVGPGRSRQEYLRAQEELLTIAGWLKTFAQALLERGRD